MFAGLFFYQDMPQNKTKGNGHIMLTSRCKEHPGSPQSYIGKSGVYQGTHYFSDEDTCKKFSESKCTKITVIVIQYVPPGKMCLQDCAFSKGKNQPAHTDAVWSDSSMDPVGLARELRFNQGTSR